MYRSEKDALAALPRCLTLRTLPNLCDDGCPYYKQCNATDPGSIYADLGEIMTSRGLSGPLVSRFLAGSKRCSDIRHDVCNADCPYWSACAGEDCVVVFQDAFDILSSAGLIS